LLVTATLSSPLLAYVWNETMCKPAPPPVSIEPFGVCARDWITAFVVPSVALVALIATLWQVRRQRAQSLEGEMAAHDSERVCVQETERNAYRVLSLLRADPNRDSDDPAVWLRKWNSIVKKATDWEITAIFLVDGI
jgi:hypothetical protein